MVTSKTDLELFCDSLPKNETFKLASANSTLFNAIFYAHFVFFAFKRFKTKTIEQKLHKSDSFTFLKHFFVSKVLWLNLNVVCLFTLIIGYNFMTGLNLHINKALEVCFR